MANDLKTIGDMFQGRRKELNLSLKDVETATSIRVSYLTAIEEGQIEKLISPIYAQGFVKQYAISLGLDGDRIVAENEELFKTAIQQEFAYGIGTLEPRNNPGASVKWVPSSVWVVAFFVLLAAAYYFASFLGLL